MPTYEYKPNIVKILKVIVRVIDSDVYWDDKSIALIYLTIYNDSVMPCLFGWSGMLN